MTEKDRNKEPVRLRRKQLKGGNESLYLDIYRNGRRTYEFLKLYLIPERTREDRERNRQTLRLANTVKAQRVVEMQNGMYGFRPRAEKTLFYPFFLSRIDSRRKSASKSTWANWESLLKHLREYEPDEHITFADITPAWVEGFRRYLDTAMTRVGDGRVRERRPLSPNTKASYFSRLRTCMNEAVREKIIQGSPMEGADGFRDQESERMYLTVEELRRLAATESDYPHVKRAFLFSCLTGMRVSDVTRLTWGDVTSQGGFTRIIFRQKKTRGQEYLDINPQAAELMGERKPAGERVFDMAHATSYINRAVRLWVAGAGIAKHISFHCARHTFAVMMLDLGTDIYTVSKLLGHRDLSTTQIYAKVLDKNKQAAVARIPDVLGDEGGKRGSDGQ